MRKLALTAAAIVLLGELMGCANDRDQPMSSRPADPTSITDTVRLYFDAYNAGDVARLNSTSCSAAQSQTAAVPPSQTILTAVDEPIVDGDSARVPVEVTVKFDGAAAVPSRTQISLVAEDGRWGVCMFERRGE